MSSTEEVVDLRHFEIIDHNIAAGYVTYIVDLWEGNRNDPTVNVVRHIGVWLGEVLEKEDGEAFDPSFYPKGSPSRYVYKNKPDNPPPLVWETIEVVKKADAELVRFKNDQQSELAEGRYRYGSAQRRAELYQAFMNAIDYLAKWPEDEHSWKAVDAWRNYNARLHEK